MTLKEEFLENPFSILEVKSTQWQQRKKEWLKLGLNNEIARQNLKDNKGIEKHRIMQHKGNNESYVSTFDPYLSELMYTWFCLKENGKILDPFAGGSVRGIVASKLGFNYTGIDIRQEQIDSNVDLANKIIETENKPKYIVGDSKTVLDSFQNNTFDMVFTCPPYFNLERYSDLKDDISNMTWEDFKISYYEIIKKCSDKLKKGGYAVFVVGDVRKFNGGYYGLIPYTIKCFMNCGMQYYNELILANPIASAAVRARQGMKKQKMVKIHQNVLVFRKVRVNNKEQNIL